MFTVYLGDLRYDNEGVGNKIIPINVGFLATYVKSHLKGEVRIRLFKDPRLLLDALQMDPPHVVALSNYPWCRNLSTEILRFVKANVPRVAVVMGGPNYSHDIERQIQFFIHREFLDFYVYMEGEEAFLNLVTRLMDSGGDAEKAKQSPIPGIHFYDRSSGQIVRGPRVPRLVELDVIESPYLAGILDEFFATESQVSIQTTRGCPFSCTFCHEGDEYFNKVRHFSLARVEAELEYIARRVRKGQLLHITDSNFGMYKQDLDVCRVIRRLQDEWGWPNEIFATAGKNKTEMIVEAARITRGAMLLSVAAQSMDPSVLEEIKRKNVSIESMRSAIEQTKKTSGVQRMTSALIVPLPGETFESAVQGMRTLVDMDMDYICTYTLLLLEGTEIASSQSRKQYGMVTKFRVVPDYYGSFRDINVVEIEEVCIGTNTISTDEYFDLRGIHSVEG